MKNENFDVEIKKFPNRMNKARALKKMKESLPKTPTKRVATLSAYLKSTNSPVAKYLRKKITSNQADEKEHILFQSVISDIRECLDKKKRKRSNEARIE